MLVTNLLVLEIFLLNNIVAEWIDIPQFSDENKVYRLPNAKQDQFYKFNQKNADNHVVAFSTYDNVTYEEDTKSEQEAVNGSEDNTFDGAKTSTEGGPIILTTSDTENILATVTEEYDDTTVPLMTEKEKEEHKQFSNESLAEDTNFLNYLPVDILKSVHRTLKSQPTSSEGKLKFLKTFENTLITEIGMKSEMRQRDEFRKPSEHRLVESVTGDRKKRGAEHYDHGSDHEHSAGFPSIEGALMAISFLTFAVYLVRLVMLLFRNMNNTQMTTASPALFVGRRKKSLNKFDEDMTMILKGLHNFSSKF